MTKNSIPFADITHNLVLNMGDAVAYMQDTNPMQVSNFVNNYLHLVEDFCW